MSAPHTKESTLFRQRVLACAGFYTGKLDGLWGNQTTAADNAFHDDYLKTQKQLGMFDMRSEGNIITMLPKTQVKARQFLRICSTWQVGITCQILSGTRTYPEQDALFAQRPVVTRARGGYSNHNFGIAWDTGIFHAGQYYTGATRAEELTYIALAKEIKAHVDGLEWGGDWKSIIDNPHYQLATGKTLTQVRQAFEAGRPFV